MASARRPVRSALVRVFPAAICDCPGKFKGAIAAMLFLLCTLASAQTTQTTTISGTVYDPRTTSSALPLPNVLVYVTTSAVSPFVPGAQCLTTSAPSGVTSYTNTAVDGTFTLTNVPVNATYTLVIQAGKWRRQFSETVADTPLTGLSLHMPSNHTQGDIPLIAIATGSVDALECVLLDMGIDSTEFTDDNQTVNAGGRIHLYKGSQSPGADINPSTPSQTALMGNSATLNGYDVVMFPCQGTASGQATTTGAANLLNFANTGGRVFATHYSFAWLNPNPPYYSQFPPVANWVSDTSFGNTTYEATVNTDFTDGATLAQWLLNSGASTTYGQVALSTVRNDFSSVVPPTQSWATLNSNNDIMQMTFNAPVGAAAANQCGRVLFNEYHVENASGIGGATFPNECPASTAMSPQEEMLEYALFDLSSFVTPVVVPTLSITFNPSPLVVNQGQTGDQVTMDVINTSSANAIDGSAALTVTLPTGLTATGLADSSSTGGWICTLATLTCTRTTGIPASGSDSVVLTVSVPAYPTGGLPSATGLISVTISSPNFSNNVSATDTVNFQQPPPITWATPAPITYGTALSATQLDATSTLAGTFSYSPAAGTVLAIGPQTLTATFTPVDTADYTTGTATVTLKVVPTTPSITVTSTGGGDAFTSNTVTFTITISSAGVAPTGTVSVYDGTTLLGTATVTNGVATYTATSLPAGTDTITAVYSGDSNYQGVTSTPISETIEDFSLALANSAAATSTAYSGGQPATYPIVISPVGGPTLAGPVAMSVTGLPPGATAVFTPATVPANSAVSNVSVQVSLPGKTTAQLLRRSGSLPVALGLLLLPFAYRMRKAANRWKRLAVLALAGAALAVGVTGCAKVSSTPQSYTLTIAGSSGALSHSTTVKLIVQLD